ncbi:hypothetical protein CCAX7_51280 [Capsulimonas corticalis]|uniref:Uncharacterized protein n=1 Tax=Capsulimonas corticalis TaxID=2219043 RepID=A0A402CPE3_9BACT|nr:SGNH/GDSL hydrolase family protein [Capsulimonas corticalis]BDI33077.1 hypothetical protein CCAX7_51280 [Capsulimonas corticalis]
MSTHSQRNRNALFALAFAALSSLLWSLRTPSGDSALAAPRIDSGAENSQPFLIQKVAPSDIRYVAVGDSYTCGTGATPRQSWPALLTRHLRAHGIPIGLAANLGVAGWTTRQALEVETPVFRKQSPTFATLMIGVNDTYRATTAEEFRIQLAALIDQMQSALPDKSKILLVTIPDFTVTRSGAEYARQSEAASKIIAFNAIIQDEAARRGLPVVDVYPLSQQMANAPDLTASDGLHPSAKEYALWERLILPAASKMLRDKAH